MVESSGSEAESPETEGSSAPEAGAAPPDPPLHALAAIFFCSGVPALIYQLIWQRSLFAIYGINVESVTVIVAAFMAGLGLGSLFGGWLSSRRGLPLLLTFGVIELTIGLFGLFSLTLFEVVGQVTLGLDTFATGAATFGLVLLPTVLMGATLPLLVEYLVRQTGNVGRSVGFLYFVNTLGSACACFAAGFFLFALFGQQAVVRIAAALNFLVGGGALWVWRSRRGVAGGAAEPEAVEEAALPEGGISFPLALVLSGLAGFIALSYEIVWFRVWSFSWATLAASFAFLLGTYLLGVAVGSSYARRYCDAGGVALQALGWFVLFANAIGFLVAPVASWLIGFGVPVATTLILVGVAAGCLGAILPLVCHAAIPPDRRAGARLSYIYLANVLGSTGGSLLTGFLLLDRFGLATTSLLLAGAGLLAGGAILVRARAPLPKVGLALALGTLPLLASGWLFSGFWDRLLYKKESSIRSPLAQIVENKSGVITVSPSGTVSGGGAYDGRFNVGLRRDTNEVVRCYYLSAIHPRPRRVLEIGLSTGSWAQILANHPELERLDIVEINPGYLGLIRERAEVRSLLENPKVHIHLDDGRRWLRRNPDARFDAVVMNATWHWRAHATNLLSREFLAMVKSRLAPGGVLFYNSTGEWANFRTAAEVFPYTDRILNFVVASESPLEPDTERLRRVLLDYRIDGRPVLDATKDAARLKEILKIFAPADDDPIAYERGESLLKRIGPGLVITDDNMGTEWTWFWTAGQ